MVTRTIGRGEGCRFVIRPNRSLSWAQTKLAYVTIVSPCLVVAAVFTLTGFWPVLPFAGTEVAALAAGFYLCALSGREVEVVCIKDDCIAIEQGVDSRRKCAELQRSWARILLVPPAVEWYPSRLVIRSRGKQVQLAAFLPESERRRLAEDLAQAISSAESFRVVRDDEAAGAAPV